MPAPLSAELPGCYLKRQRTPRPWAGLPTLDRPGLLLHSHGVMSPGQEAAWGGGRGPAEPTPSSPFSAGPPSKRPWALSCGWEQ